MTIKETLKATLQTLFVFGTIGYFGFETGRSCVLSNVQRELGLAAMTLQDRARASAVLASSNTLNRVYAGKAEAYEDSSRELSRLAETFRRR